MMRLWRIALPVAAAPVVAALLFGFLSAQLQIADSVSHFRLHLGGLLLLLTGLMWIGGVRRAAIVSGAAAAIGLWPLGPEIGKGMHEVQAAHGPEIKLFQLNLFVGNTSPQAIVNLIVRHDPDVITFQEVTPSTRMILDALRERYPIGIVCKARNVGSVAVLSRFPKESEGCIDGEGLAWLRLHIEGRAVTFASMHLAWPYPFGQHEQIDRLKPQLEMLQSPIVIGGDFNAAPWSHAVGRIADATSTHVASGIHLTWEWPLFAGGPLVGFLPIDHVLMSRELTPLSAEVGPGVGSDHLPVIASFALPRLLAAGLNR